MKHILTFLLIAVIIIAIVLLVFGVGLGLGKGNGDVDGNGDDNAIETTSNELDNSQASDINTNSTDNTSSDENNVLIIRISVVESDYFYDNQPISLDDFIAILLDYDVEITVEITDNNASLRAYNKLTDALKSSSIPYTEVK